MADLIERDMTIHELEAFRESCIANLVRMSFDDITDVVKDIPAVNRWISVKDALPEIYEKVLTADIDGYVTENYRCNVRAGLEWSKGFRITHWMPKPEPPKKEC